MTTLGQNFPPRSNRTAEFSLILTAFGSILEKRSAYYLSVPITSGKRYMEMRHLSGSGEGSREDSDNLRAQLIQLSRVQTEPFVRHLRSQLSSCVIDPTAIELPNWDQADYHVFWASVIERYVHTVIFTEDWHYSRGCIYEYLTAIETGAKTLTKALALLPLDSGLKLIKRALTELRHNDENAAFHDAVAHRLQCFTD